MAENTTKSNAGHYIDVFSKAGGVAFANLGKRPALITIVQPKGIEMEDPKLYFAYAPATGISIKQLTDHTINKALSGDFMLASFGDTPVDIQLSGVCFFGVKCGQMQAQLSNNDIMEFYNKNKVSENPSARLDITMGTSNNAFRCALIGMKSQSTNEGDMNGLLYTYNLSLVGVLLKPTQPEGNR